MDHDHESPDRAEAAPRETAEAAEAPEGPGLFRTLLSLASKIPLPSLGSERHERIERPHHPPSAEAGHDHPSEHAHAPARPSPFYLKLETRVGIAALLSFLLLVGAMVARKRGTEPAKDSKETAELAQDPKAQAGKPPITLAIKTGGEEKDKDKDKDKPDREPGTAPPKPEATTPPEPTPVDSPSSPARELADLDKVALPPKPDESPRRGELADAPNSPPPALPPDPKLPRPPETPQGPTDPLTVEMPPTLGSAPPTMPEPTPAVAEAPAKPAEVDPAPSSGLPTLGSPSSLVPPVETPSTPATAPDPPAGPVLTEKPPTLERVPAAIESAATKTSIASALGTGWASIPSGGRRIVGAVPIVSTPMEARIDPPRVAESPRVSSDSDTTDQVEPVVHVVQPGENFWTISKLYYHTGRFYKALHAANRKQVPDIASLYVGTVLRIPPPEALDRLLIDPAGRPSPGEPTTSIVSRTSKRSEPEEADLAMPPRRRAAPADPEATPAPRRPTYKVKDYETLRSIARDTLNDPKRDRDIFNLNRDALEAIDDPIPAGTMLTLPEDATLGRRAR